VRIGLREISQLGAVRYWEQHGEAEVFLGVRRSVDAAVIVPESVEARIAPDPAVAQSSPMLVRLLSILQGYSAPALGWKDGSFLWDSVSIIEGRKSASAGAADASRR